MRQRLLWICKMVHFFPTVLDSLEHAIQQTIKTELEQSTLIVIAHRIHTVIECDRIMVMDKGEVKEFDTPAALISNKNSIFFKLYNSHRTSIDQ
jgi:ABC-type multidrug transport system fused ATPase/permease subunit